MTRLVLIGLAALALCCGSLCGCGDPKQSSQGGAQAEVTAHPGYEAAMQALVSHLSENNVAAVWPGGFGGMVNADTIVVSLPPGDRDDAGAELAARVYSVMMAARQQSGYGGQAGACFVHVLNSAGQEVAVDRMGKI